MEKMNVAPTEEFKNYYKFPLKMWNDFAIKVFTDDNCMAFDWLLPHSDEFTRVKEKFLKIINGEEGEELKFNIRKTFTYDGSGKIYVTLEEGENQGRTHAVCLVRGWGMLTGTGGYHLEAEEATRIQDDFAKYIIGRLNDANR